MEISQVFARPREQAGFIILPEEGKRAYWELIPSNCVLFLV